MNNPCKRCLELDFCREGRHGVPCLRRRDFEKNIDTIRREVEETINRQKLKKEGDMVARDKGKGQIRKGNP